MSKPTTLADIIDLAAEASAKRTAHEKHLAGEPLTPEEKKVLIDSLRDKFAEAFKRTQR